MKITRWMPKLRDCLLVAGIVVLFYCLQIPCLFQWLFHIPCMGCGMTRAYLCLLQGDVGGAFGYHPMFWSIPLLVVLYFTDGKLFRKFWMNTALIGVLLAGFVVNWIVQLCLLG